MVVKLIQEKPKLINNFNIPPILFFFLFLKCKVTSHFHELLIQIGTCKSHQHDYSAYITFSFQLIRTFNLQNGKHVFTETLSTFFFNIEISCFSLNI